MTSHACGALAFVAFLEPPGAPSSFTLDERLPTIEQSLRQNMAMSSAAYDIHAILQDVGHDLQNKRLCVTTHYTSLLRSRSLMSAGKRLAHTPRRERPTRRARGKLNRRALPLDDRHLRGRQPASLVMPVDQRARPILVDEHGVPDRGRGIVVPQLRSVVDPGRGAGPHLEHRHRIHRHDRARVVAAAVDRRVRIAAIQGRPDLQVGTVGQARARAQLDPERGARMFAIRSRARDPPVIALTSPSTGSCRCSWRRSRSR